MVRVVPSEYLAWAKKGSLLPTTIEEDSGVTLKPTKVFVLPPSGRTSSPQLATSKETCTAEATIKIIKSIRFIIFQRQNLAEAIMN